jgi:hypothetical protein
MTPNFATVPWRSMGKRLGQSGLLSHHQQKIMNEKPKLDPRNYRPAFFVEKENKEIEVAEGMRTCVGYATLTDASGEWTVSEIVCGRELARGLRYYCSGECMNNAKARGDYRND